MEISPGILLFSLIVMAGITGGLENDNMSIYEAIIQIGFLFLFVIIYSFISKLVKRAWR